MELRTQRISQQDEYEEVESPYAEKSASKVRPRKNVFNRPFSAEPSAPPAVFETTSRRRSIGHADNTDLVEHRASELMQTEIEYLDEEEEEEVLPKRKPRESAKKKEKLKGNLLPRIGWSIIGLLVLRLICMDRGVYDYFATEGDIREQQSELRSINKENKELKLEVARIQLDKNYQRQLAKEHLGVIAADEFLILFAGETSEKAPKTTEI